MPKTKTRFSCGACGAETPRWLGRCPGCGEWDALHEAGPQPGAGVDATERPEPRPICDLTGAGDRPFPTRVGELDRALGGGLVPGSVTLVGGEPGCGKSTLALQVAAGAAREGRRCLVVSGEESTRQVQARAERVGASVEGVTVVSETSLPRALSVVDDLAPQLLVIDSIQSTASPEATGIAGSVSQVRECAQRLVDMAKTSGVAVVLIGHVTKEGDLAGPRTLEHLVDTVVSVEGDRHHALRFVRVLKHRFGPTDQLGVLELRGGGLVDVPDPSELFLADRQPDIPGSVVTAVLDGARPLTVEVQALLAPTSVPNPRRSAQGIEAGRLAQLLAVLDQRAGFEFRSCDVYVSAAGGFRVAEPGAHLGVALALTSAALDRAVPEGLVVLGEVGLGGEIRQVAAASRRLHEAARLGFRAAVAPRATPSVDGLEVRRVRTIGEAAAAAGLT